MRRARRVPQKDSAALCGASHQGLHLHRLGVARRRGRPEHHGQLGVRVCPTATPTAAQHRLDRCRRTPRQFAEYCNAEDDTLAEFDAAVAEVRPPTSRRRMRARAFPSLLNAMIATHALPQHGVPRLRSSAYAEAVAARCASHGARSAAAVGRQKVVREHPALPRSVRGGGALRTPRSRGTQLATHCEFGVARTPPPVGRVAAVRTAD